MDFGLDFIFNHLPCYVYWVDKDLIYRGCNILYANLLGMANSHQIEGNDFLSTQPLKESVQLWKKIKSNNLSVLKAQKPSSFKEEYVLKNGNSIDVISKKVPLFDEENRIAGLLNVSFSKLENEKQLINSNLNPQIALDNIVANLPGHVYWKDVNGVYLGCNDKQANSLGIKHSHEIIGKTDFDLPWKKSSAEEFRRNDLHIMKKNKQTAFEEAAIFEGKQAVVLSYKSPLKDNSGNTVGILGISIDITARKKAEEALQKVNDQLDKNNQAKAKFLRILQHNLRNKLTGILSFSDLLLDSLEDKELLKTGLSIINRAGREILPTLDRINHYLSLEIGQLKPYACPFDLTATLQHFAKDYQNELSAKGLKMECTLDPKVGNRFEGDYALICDVLGHLIKNAIKYTDQGIITLETHFLRKRGEYMWLDIVVSDTGRGISKEAEKNLFKSFDYDPEDKQYTNPGINLSISKKIAQLLGGDLLVDSFEDKGTTFTFYLKLKIEKPIKSIPTPQGRLSYEEVSSMTLEPFHPEFHKDKFLVLVIEDDPLNQEALKALLSSYFYCDILLAADLKTARELVHKNQNNIDLVLTDIQLPDGEGQEIIPYLRRYYSSQENFPWIIAVTAFARDVDIQHFIEEGVADVISKPITLQDLSGVIVSLFGDKILKKIH